MARQRRSKKTNKNANGANLGFEEKLWQAADKLRGTVDAAEYKHVVLGLLFLKYISDAFEARRHELERLCDDTDSDYFVDGDEEQKQAILEDRDEYLAENVFWVPLEARWQTLQAVAKKPDTRHLGFTRVTEAVRKPVKSAINAAIRRGVVGYEGRGIWREE